MGFKEGEIDGVHVKRLVKHMDKRGVLTQTFRLDILPQGLHPQMSYVSYTKPGVSRGPHEHKEQTDIFAFLGPGKFKLYLFDSRRESKTYGNKKVLSVGSDNPVLVVIPPGVVHGYKNISKNVKGMVINYPNKLYRGWGEKEGVDEIRHEDNEDELYKDFIE